ncbi:thioredoxin family protein [Plantactinospora sp. BB1]|uniref:TlpA family protein disulfide reductase n=1 Tax=Plantactinospora sp. BB1 TaxID=2071627 RepID=UPI000D1633DD|nr:thioredoxin family protein [Plantactinospora sp. BB1]AVT39444.1 thioredoxin [Plantactinospora sp. BB1]
MVIDAWTWQSVVVQNAALSGSVAAVATLLLAAGYGLWRRHFDGRLRRQSPTNRLSRAGFGLRSDDGSDPAADLRRQPPAAPPPRPPGADPAAGNDSTPGADPAAGNGSTPGAGVGLPVDPALLAALGVRPGASATLLQFSSAFCAPCRATRQVLADVTETLDGVRHVEVDAESQLPAVRALGIWRTPTVLLVDADGRIVQRAAGVPARAQVLAAVAPLLPRGPS